MGKRELKALAKAQAEASAARQAVYAALWADPRYRAMCARLDVRNHAVTLAETDVLLGLGEQATVDAAKRRFSRYHRRLQAIENAALARAGLTP